MKPSLTRAEPRQSLALAPRAHSVRIIGGHWKRTSLTVANVPGLRPTPDRVRETLFNWLTHIKGGSLGGMNVLDLFAGTGALGFEAASRGATHVIMLENAPQALQMLEASRDRLAATQIEIRRGDASVLMQTFLAREQRFDIIFLDPPFRSGWLERVGPMSVELLTAGGLLYVEAEAPIDPMQFGGETLEIVRADKAGQVFYHLLRRKMGDDPREKPPC